MVIMGTSSPESTPGQSALNVMKDLGKEVIFKVPQSTPKRKSKQKVLDEDTYIEGMGKIIERDFFPDLPKLKAHAEYLDAVDRNDVVRIRELYATYRGQSERSNRIPSPATFETPANIHNSQHIPEEATPEVTIISDEKKEEKRLSLDQYLNSHTSEDNQSFEEIMEESERKHKAKFAYLYNEEEGSALEQKKQLALPSIEQQCLLPEKKLNVDTWTYKNKNYIMYIPDGVAPTPQEQAERERKRLEVVHGNTRLSVNPFNDTQSHETISEMAKQQAHVLDGKIGVDGKELVGATTPQVNGFRLMREPSPHQLVVVAASPLMTWGHVEGTPYRLDGSETPLRAGPAFKMNEPPKREQLAFALAEKANERQRDQKRKAINAARCKFSSPSPYTPHSSRDRLVNMSPAAQRLATNQLRLGSSSSYSTTASSPAFASAYQRRKTPTSQRTPLASSSTPKLNLGIRKPHNQLHAEGHAAGVEDHLTDDLLNIKLPKRQKAADFF